MWKWLANILASVLGNLITPLVILVLVAITTTFAPWFKSLATHWKVLLILGSGILSGTLYAILRIGRRDPSVTDAPFVGAQRELAINLNRVAQEAFQSDDAVLVDDTHHFIEIVCSYTIVAYDASYLVNYKGRNTSRKPSRSIVRGLAGDSAVDRDLLDIEVVSVESSEPLHWEFLDDNETPFRKPFRVYFTSPLKRGDMFSIEVSCKWPGTFARREDYVFFPSHHFRKGVDTARLEVVLGARPARYEGVELIRGKYKLAATQPTLKYTENGWLLSVVIRKPKRLYAIWFTRTDI